MDAFWQAIAQHDWVQPEIRQEFRVYHDEQGRITCYSMEDLPGNYIVIDRMTFDQCRMDLRVKDGRLIKISHDASWKLAPAESADRACHAQDITIIVDEEHSDKKYWKVITTHEQS